jgi:uncharacterized repeat protein (TIGR01451 family)
MNRLKSVSSALMTVAILLNLLVGLAALLAVPAAAAQPAAEPGTLPSTPGNWSTPLDLGATAPQSPAAPTQAFSSRWACTPPMIDGVVTYVEWGTAPHVDLPNGKGTVYFLNDAANLYVLLDVPADTVDDPPMPAPPWGDYFFLTLDVNGNGLIDPYLDLNYGILPSLPYQLVYSYYITGSQWTSPMTSTGALGYSWGASNPPHSWAHRVGEISIPLAEIGAGPGSMIYAGIRAYSQNPAFTDELPPNFTNDFSNLLQVQLAETACSVQLAKQVFPTGMVSPGDVLIYQIEYTLGPGANYTNVTLSDALPPGVSYVPGSAVPPATYAGGVLTWNLGNLPGGAHGFVRFQVVVTNEACAKQRVLIDYAQMAIDSPSLQITSNAAVSELLCRPIGPPPSNSPSYAEDEITVDPYPLNVGQLTQLCTVVQNPSNVTQTVNVQFNLAIFGMGIPFTPITAPGNPGTIVIPPGGSVTYCIFWTPTTPGHQCVQVVLSDASVPPEYPPYYSQRNLDIAEALIPGQPTTFSVPVYNSQTYTASIMMMVVNLCPGWTVTVSPTNFMLGPAGTQNVNITVTPPATATLGSGCTIDIQAWEVDPATGAPNRMIGGIRKYDYPPVPPSQPGEPIFAEREIRVHPYPLITGQPTQVCATLANNTGVTQTVTVEFHMSTLGIGLIGNVIPAVGTPPNPQTVVIPPHSSIVACMTFLPSTPGHHCLSIKLSMPGADGRPNGYVTWSYQNLDVAELLEPGLLTDVPIPVANPTAMTATITLVVNNTCPGWTATVSPTVLYNVGPNSSDVRTVILTVTPPAGPLGSNCHIDLEAYINGVLIGGVRKIDRPPTAPPITEPPYAEYEITAHPDPPVVGQPTQLCVTLNNPTNVTQTLDVGFDYADFGAGILFTHIQTVTGVLIPPNGTVTVCITWVPGAGGTLHRCIRVHLHNPHYHDVYSQRNFNLVRINPRDFLVPGYVLELPPFVIHNPDPGPDPIILDYEMVGLHGFLLPAVQDADTGEQFAFGEEIPFMGGQDRRLMLVLQGMGLDQAAPPELLGAESYIDVIPYQNGQQMTVDGLPSGLRFGIETIAWQVYLPIVARNTP